MKITQNRLRYECACGNMRNEADLCMWQPAEYKHLESRRARTGAWKCSQPGDIKPQKPMGTASGKGEKALK